MNELEYDTKVPQKLKETEKWFASIITRPIDENSLMDPISPTGHLMEEEAFDYLVPSATLKPAQRIEIYNQQYWWRLLTIMQDTCPLLTRLFGPFDFNQIIAKPYLVKYPPHSWSLNGLADYLPKWVEDEYQENDKQLVLDAAKLDVAYNNAFFTKHHYPISAKTTSQNGGLQNMLEKTLALQPHVFLFTFRYDLLKFREEMLEKEVEHWIDNDFPKLPQDKTHYFILYRSVHNQLKWESLSEGCYKTLSQFKNDFSLDLACDWLESQEGEILEEASSKLHLWLQEWVAKEWLYAKS